MTKEQIVQQIINAILSLILFPFIKMIFAPFIPERKKLISYIKKSFAFALLYILPIASVVYLMITTRVLDKTFVLFMLIDITVLGMNITVLVVIKLTKVFVESSKEYIAAVKNHTQLLQFFKDIPEVKKKDADNIPWSD